MLADVALYLAVGAAAGLLAGLLGVGGGLIIVAALSWLLPLRGFDPAHVMHVALATSLASIIVTSISSTRAHWRRGSVLWPTVRVLAPGTVLGGFAGAQLATWLASDSLRWVVAGYCGIAAAQLLFGQVRSRGEAEQPPTGLPIFAAGAGIGLMSAVVGIGGGSMTVPLLVWLGVAPVRAVGTSAACGFAIALASAIGFVYGGYRVDAAMPPGSIGFVYLPAAAGMACASVLVAPLGARLAHALSGDSLKRVFALFLLVMGAAVALS
ncbi:sulfite exporter TauE/SafE family protein [Tahibacter amnicola]|uniref:Probable membrane transporter protein n=1 Tax=Tahibacter amnicola TaxID=2976241 RepID=A0ABY6BEL0_9GAMM|nr:sulfite exporter TauE/SafE family protein [Tahibacter amnicola]UXI68222.1 sulfite exporter TauE/SafE family protein [Tahibacter amnicola]